jgi:hypothetical protein
MARKDAAREDFAREIEREEVDLLVKQMAARRLAAQIPTTPPAQTSAAASQNSTPQETQPAAASSASKSSRWSTNRILMPSLRGNTARKSLALTSGISLQSLPALPKLELPAWTEAQWEVLTARLFVALAVVQSIAMPYWPYRTDSSWSLGFYLTAVVILIVTGIWGSKLTWDSRLARSHSISIVTIIWGLVLVAGVVLPKMGLPV